MYGHFSVNLPFPVLFLSQLPITGSVKLQLFFTVHLCLEFIISVAPSLDTFEPGQLDYICGPWQPIKIQGHLCLAEQKCLLLTFRFWDSIL